MEKTTWNSLHVGQRLACKLQDVSSRAHEDEQQLGKFVPGDPLSNGHQPLPHDQQDEQDLVQSQDPVIGAYGRQELC